MQSRASGGDPLPPVDATATKDDSLIGVTQAGPSTAGDGGCLDFAVEAKRLGLQGLFDLDEDGAIPKRASDLDSVCTDGWVSGVEICKRAVSPENKKKVFSSLFKKKRNGKKGLKDSKKRRAARRKIYSSSESTIYQDDSDGYSWEMEEDLVMYQKGEELKILQRKLEEFEFTYSTVSELWDEKEKQLGREMKIKIENEIEEIKKILDPYRKRLKEESIEVARKRKVDEDMEKAYEKKEQDDLMERYRKKKMFEEKLLEAKKKEAAANIYGQKKMEKWKEDQRKKLEIKKQQEELSKEKEKVEIDNSPMDWRVDDELVTVKWTDPNVTRPAVVIPTEKKAIKISQPEKLKIAGVSRVQIPLNTFPVVSQEALANELQVFYKSFIDLTDYIQTNKNVRMAYKKMCVSLPKNLKQILKINKKLIKLNKDTKVDLPVLAADKE